MEIEIESKRNNPLLNRTEIYFTIKHEGEKTPNREIIRSELAEKLNVKKESVIVNNIQSSFGNQVISCYAKVYTSLSKSKEIEKDHILKRNGIGEPEKKQVKKEESKAPSDEKAVEQKEQETKQEETKEAVENKEPSEKSEEKSPHEDSPQKTDDKPSEEKQEKEENKAEEKKDEGKPKSDEVQNESKDDQKKE